MIYFLSETKQNKTKKEINKWTKIQVLSFEERTKVGKFWKQILAKKRFAKHLMKENKKISHPQLNLMILNFCFSRLMVSMHSIISVSCYMSTHEFLYECVWLNAMHSNNVQGIRSQIESFSLFFPLFLSALFNFLSLVCHSQMRKENVWKR